MPTAPVSPLLRWCRENVNCLTLERNFIFYEISIRLFLVFFSLTKGKKPAAKPVIEMGTQQNTDIDYDWLPKETTTEFGML